jgi:hypothetical protein
MPQEARALERGHTVTLGRDSAGAVTDRGCFDARIWRNRRRTSGRRREEIKIAADASREEKGLALAYIRVASVQCESVGLPKRGRTQERDRLNTARRRVPEGPATVGNAIEHMGGPCQPLLQAGGRVRGRISERGADESENGSAVALRGQHADLAAHQEIREVQRDVQSVGAELPEDLGDERQGANRIGQRPRAQLNSPRECSGLILQESRNIVLQCGNGRRRGSLRRGIKQRLPRGVERGHESLNLSRMNRGPSGVLIDFRGQRKT